MTIKQNSDRHAKLTAKQLTNPDSISTSYAAGLWRWVNGVANGVSHFITHTILDGFRASFQHDVSVVDTFFDVMRTLQRIIFWVDFLVWHTVASWISKLRHEQQGALRAAVRMLERLIYVRTEAVYALAMRAVRHERIARQRQVAHAEAEARARVRALHGTIEREAASGYRMEARQRAGIIVTLLDFAATRNPAIRAITSDLAKTILDLIEVDDPLVRIGLTFIVKEVIDRLGIDKALGTLIGDLISTITGQVQPRGLHGVVYDIALRLGAMEGQWAQFFTDGGSQVEQAGNDWKDITSVIGNAAIVAFTVQAAVDPSGWAAEIADTLGTVADDLSVKAVSLFGG